MDCVSSSLKEFFLEDFRLYLFWKVRLFFPGSNLNWNKRWYWLGFSDLLTTSWRVFNENSDYNFSIFVDTILLVELWTLAQLVFEPGILQINVACLSNFLHHCDKSSGTNCCTRELVLKWKDIYIPENESEGQRKTYQFFARFVKWSENRLLHQLRSHYQKWKTPDEGGISWYLDLHWPVSTHSLPWKQHAHVAYAHQHTSSLCGTKAVCVRTLTCLPYTDMEIPQSHDDINVFLLGFSVVSWYNHLWHNPSLPQPILYNNP